MIKISRKCSPYVNVQLCRVKVVFHKVGLKKGGPTHWWLNTIMWAGNENFLVKYMTPPRDSFQKLYQEAKKETKY